jgi:hypothetical protein
MREISPTVGMSVDEYLNLAPEIRPLITEIRRQKEAGERLRPSAALVDRSQMLTPECRRKLLDKIASLVDENYAGRSEMCQQFADLLHRALRGPDSSWTREGQANRSAYGNALCA